MFSCRFRTRCWCRCSYIVVVGAVVVVVIVGQEPPSNDCLSYLVKICWTRIAFVIIFAKIERKIECVHSHLGAVRPQTLKIGGSLLLCRNWKCNLSIIIMTFWPCETIDFGVRPKLIAINLCVPPYYMHPNRSIRAHLLARIFSFFMPSTHSKSCSHVNYMIALLAFQDCCSSPRLCS